MSRPMRLRSTSRLLGLHTSRAGESTKQAQDMALLEKRTGRLLHTKRIRLQDMPSNRGFVYVYKNPIKDLTPFLHLRQSDTTIVTLPFFPTLPFSANPLSLMTLQFECGAVAHDTTTRYLNTAYTVSTFLLP